MKSVAIMCDKGYQHLPWGLTKDGSGLFATAQERNYPELFCTRVAKQAAKDLGVVKIKAEKVDCSHNTAAGRQPRKEFNDLIPEYKQRIEFKGATPLEVSNVNSR